MDLATKITGDLSLKNLINEADINHINVGVFDLNGILRGKRMSKSKFLSSIDNGFGFCDVIIGWDTNDEQCTKTPFTGWHTGYPDAKVNIVESSIRSYPYEDNGLFCLGEFSGKAAEICPRTILKNVIKKANTLGLFPQAACEYEFFVFNETHFSITEKNFKNLSPLTPGAFGYSAIRGMVDAELHSEFLELFESLNIPLEGLHTETGPGVLEAAIAVDTALQAADKAALFKTFTKGFFQRKGLIATFMARWSLEHPGSGGHIHVSLLDENGNNCFFDKNKDHNISDTMRHFIAGQQLMLPELTSLMAPNVNSFTRLVPGYWAPTFTTWGIENRTTALRAITGSSKAQRVETRIPGADSNPYLAMAASLAAGICGIENKLEPTDPIIGNSYAMPHDDKLKLPKNLHEAADRLDKSELARNFFGDVFVDNYVATRIWEADEAARQITDYQLNRYFEII